MQQGLVAPLDPNHTAVVAAARKLAKQAAVARAEKQVGGPCRRSNLSSCYNHILLLLWHYCHACSSEAASCRAVLQLQLSAAAVVDLHGSCEQVHATSTGSSAASIQYIHSWLLHFCYMCGGTYY
jgi:hypothetical protein